jgi:hypothetical protein
MYYKTGFLKTVQDHFTTDLTRYNALKKTNSKKHII